MSETDMMVESILAQAREEAERILADARAKAEERLNGAKRDVEARTEEIMAEARMRAETGERRIATRIELEARKSLLRAKVALLNEVFENVRRNLAGLPEDEWAVFIGKLLVENAVTGREKVAVPPGQQKRFEPLLESVNEKLRREGRSGGLRLAGEPAPIEDGFLLDGDDYSVECSFSTLMAERRPALEPEVAKVLFGEER